MSRILGGSPAATIVKLVFLSLLVGAFMSLLGLTPETLIARAVTLAQGLWDAGFDAVHTLLRWLLYGAVLVVPLWLLSRLFGARR